MWRTAMMSVPSGSVTTAGRFAIVSVDRIATVGRLMVGALMNEPGVADVTNLKLLRFPPGLDVVDLTLPDPAGVEEYAYGENIKLSGNQVPVLVEDDRKLTIT